MAGVGQQRQRPGDNAANDLYDHEHTGQDKRDHYSTQVFIISLVDMRMSVVMIVIMAMVIMVMMLVFLRHTQSAASWLLNR